MIQIESSQLLSIEQVSNTRHVINHLVILIHSSQLETVADVSRLPCRDELYNTVKTFTNTHSVDINIMIK